MNQMSALTFSFTEQAVRVVTLDDQPWFVAADVCSTIGLSHVTNAVRPL